MTEREHRTNERDSPMPPPAPLLFGLRLSPRRLPAFARDERTYIVGCLVAILIGSVAWLWATAGSTADPGPVDPPTIVRTIDGTVTTPMPEDLDRPGR